MSAAVLPLESRLDLRATGPLVEALKARRGADLALDAGAVTMIGALALQAIRAAARDWSEEGRALTLVNATPELGAQLALMGFSPDDLTDWEAAR